ncbi:MAG TPA: hypothetical protein VGO56_21765 [Pyrinomonadaceae bacterium]|jgi:hypothetical protein|nr:hypothetical protein [Pyrinomonadaceae bacterium]
MSTRVNTPARIEAARAKISEFLAAHAEWFCTLDGGNSQALGRNELDIAVSYGRLILSSWTEKGSRAWKIFDCELTGEKLTLRASRRMGAERPLIELVPRAAASAIALTVKAARQQRSIHLGELACATQMGAKLERASLSPGARRGQPGRYARILLRQKHQRIAVTGSIAASKASDADAFLSSALLWFKRTSERLRTPYVQHLWLVCEHDLVKPIAQRVAMLRAGLRETIAVFEVDEQLAEMNLVDVPARENLWKRKLARFPPVPAGQPSALASQLTESGLDAIDVVSARHGETLRYFGLPFARVRRVMDSERLWFGIDGARRRLLDEKTEPEWQNLLTDLLEHRTANASDHHHALYRNAAEAWLESLLRRDITRLDPGLIIAPLHAQFRTARGGVLGVRPVDLLALRQDGRLVVIELKVTEAREHVFQGVDYWQRVEAHRRRGHIARAKLFGERKISNQSPLVYLVAPTLRVHPSFTTLARSIDPEIEIYRFDINEDWRAGVRVMRRLRVNHSP